MKQAILIIAFALTVGVPAAHAGSPTLSLVAQPTVVVLNNPSCDEIIYTYHVLVVTHDQNLRLADATLEVVDSGEASVVQVGTSSTSAVIATGQYATDPVSIAIPCASDARYEIYGDVFEVPAYTAEDFTVKLFFTPAEPGSYQARLTGLSLDAYISTATNTGGGLCMNCIKVTNDDPVLSDFETTLTSALSTMNADDTALVHTFLALLRTLEVIG